MLDILYIMIYITIKITLGLTTREIKETKGEKHESISRIWIV